MYLVGAKKHRIDPSTFRVVNEKDMSTQLIFESECALVVSEQAINQIEIEYSDVTNKRLSVVARLLEQSKTEESQFIFDRSYQTLATSQRRFTSRGLSSSSVVQVRIHRVVKKSPGSTDVVEVDARKTALIRLEGSGEDSILTDKFRVVISCNGQYESSAIMDSSGDFCDSPCHWFGYSGNDATVRFDLVLDNCFNRSDQLK